MRLILNVGMHKILNVGMHKMDLSRFCAAPSARSSHLPFESDSPVLSGGDADCRSLCGCKKFFRLLGASDQCSRVSGLYTQLACMVSVD